MAEELQGLIDKIQRDAIEAGERQAADLVAKAREQAASIVREAEAKAKALLEKAEQDSLVFTERSRQTLQQAARDLLITVGRGVENILSDLSVTSVNNALGPEVLQQMIVKMAEAYASRSGRDRRVELLLSPEDQQKLLHYFKGVYQEKMKAGLELKADDRVFKGFKVAFVDDRVHHDFTAAAIAEALGTFLRPHLSEIVARAALESAAARGGDAR